jgi:hypothetical protein
MCIDKLKFGIGLLKHGYTYINIQGELEQIKAIHFLFYEAFDSAQYCLTLTYLNNNMGDLYYRDSIDRRIEKVKKWFSELTILDIEEAILRNNDFGVK